MSDSKKHSLSVHTNPTIYLEITSLPSVKRWSISFFPVEVEVEVVEAVVVVDVDAVDAIDDFLLLRGS